MRLETKWFLYILKVNQIISDKELSEMPEGINLDAPLDEFISAFFAKKLASFHTHEESEHFIALLNQAKGLAADNSKDGHEVPEEIYTAQKKSSQSVSFAQLSGNDPKTISDYIRNMLKELKANGASDLHITSNAPAFIRKHLTVQRIDERVIPKEETDSIIQALLTNEQLNILKEHKTITFALSFGNEERYRTTVINQKDGLSISFHLVSNKIRSLEELGFSKTNIETIKYFLSHHNGLILVTGPLGSGKTTTLASIVNEINKQRHDHVLMIENPIEIVQESISCNVTQREINSHTQSYASAIKASLREDPDIIVVGELNDLETIEIAIKASETGHLVIGTLQTSDASNTLNRLINTFPPFQQPQIKAMLSTSLRGIICQRLLPKIGGGTVLATEIMVNNLAVANTITEGKLFLLKSIMQTASKAGMSSMDASIYELFTHGKISKETGILNVLDKKNYGRQIELGK